MCSYCGCQSIAVIGRFMAEHMAGLCAEHTALDESLAAIRTGDLDRLPAFLHLLRRHIDREDNGLFPAAAIALDGPDWEHVDEVTPEAS